jgi:hypothetical protein
MNATTMMTDTHYKPSDARQFSDGTFPRPLREGCLFALFLKDRVSSSSKKAFSSSLATMGRVRGGGGKVAKGAEYPISNEQLAISNEARIAGNEQWSFQSFRRSFQSFRRSFQSFGRSFQSFGRSFQSFGKSFQSFGKTVQRKGQNVRNGLDMGTGRRFRYGLMFSATGVKAKNNFFVRRDYGKII